MPDRKSSGRIVALTIGAAASELGITVVMAKPSAQKLAAPTTRMTRNWNSDAPVGISALYRTLPKVTVIATRSSATSRACNTLAPKKTALGSGVPRVRLRTPASRWKDSPLAMLL